MLSRGNQSRSKRLTILDFLRGVAIICVVIDHVFPWLGVEGGIWHQLTIYSVVPLFFLAGITFAMSFLRHLPVLTWRNFLPYYWHKVKKLLGAYALGTFIILCFQPGGITWSDYWFNLFTFPAQFYFIAIYAELLLVAPFLLQLWLKVKTTIKRARQPLFYFILSLLLCAFSLICAKILIFPPPLWLPARQLFGGLEFFVFAMGTLAGFLYVQGWRLSVKQKYALFISGLGALFLVISTPIHEQIFVHPPSFWTLFYAAALTVVLAAFYRLCRRFYRFPFLVWCGQHSLDIYIYHTLVIQLLVERTNFFVRLPIFWQIFVLTFLASVAPILWSDLLRKIQLLGGKLFSHKLG